MDGIKHGKGVGYDKENNLKYEGEFINGKKNGKGKEYIKNNNVYNNEFILLFEGEYFNNYRLRGKEYYKNGKLKYEGEYLFKKEYYGKIYDDEGNIVFELKDNNGIFENNDDGLGYL